MLFYYFQQRKRLAGAQKLVSNFTEIQESDSEEEIPVFLELL
jgi:hypothetical protein